MNTKTVYPQNTINFSDDDLQISVNIASMLGSPEMLELARQRAAQMGMSLAMWFVTAASRELVITSSPSSLSKKKSVDVFGGAQPAPPTTNVRRNTTKQPRRSERLASLAGIMEENVEVKDMVLDTMAEGHVGAIDRIESLLQPFREALVDAEQLFDVAGMEPDEELRQDVLSCIQSVKVIAEQFGVDFLVSLDDPFDDGREFLSIDSLIDRVGEIALDSLPAIIPRVAAQLTNSINSVPISDALRAISVDAGLDMGNVTSFVDLADLLATMDR